MKRMNIISWILYDFGMAQFSMVILTAYFILYFKQIIVGNIGGRGDLLWGVATSISMAFAVLLSPILGTYSDISHRRKGLYIIFSSISIVSTFLLFFSDRNTVLYSMLFFILAYSCYSINMTFYNSFLPDIVREEEIGKYSGIGWGLGYFGGLTSLIIMIFVVREIEDSKIIILITAFSYLIFAIPSYIILPEQKDREKQNVNLLAGFVELKRTFNNIKGYKEIFIFLLAYFFISDGISTVIVFFSSYTVHTLKFTLKENFILLIIIQIFAAIGAISSGYIARKFGIIKSIIITVIIWIVSLFIIFIAESKSLFFLISSICGTVLGGTQALARSFIAVSSPREKTGEFFGFMT
ncbi:MAG: MFS transporter, partial [Myxococcota bacterium]